MTQRSENGSERKLLAPSQGLQDFPLPTRQVVGHGVGRNVAAGKKAHGNSPALLDELRFWMAGLYAELDDSLGSSAPSLDQTSAVEDVGEQRVAGAGAVPAFEISQGDPRG